MLDRLRAFAGDSNLSDLEALDSFAPRPRFVWIRRRDVVAQAVSWSRAIQGGRWWSGATEPEGALEFDFDQIDHLVREIEEHHAGWRSWFTATGAEPHEVAYEELAVAPEAVAADVLRFLGVESSATTAPQERQADELNADWAARYRASLRSTPTSVRSASSQPPRSDASSS